ncbi:MAG: hypothetical protein NC828_01225 [Candidatus Omnitrophica bacterium]|nr:hypothetical protein [Candidatus Omnitrophota bacterium]
MARKPILVLIGIIGLAIGASEYINGRMYIYGRLGMWLPDFFHCFSFSLIFIGVFSHSKFSRFGFCLLWFFINLLFEIGQRFGGWVSAHIPYWFGGIPVFKNTHNYFMYGRFDIFDVMAFFLGAMFAYLISELIIGGGYEEVKTNN